MKGPFMKVAFIDLFEDFYDKHPIYCLSACLKEHDISVEYVFGRTAKTVINKLYDIKPHVLLYSAFSAQMPQYIYFDKIVKNNFKIISVIGGPGPTYDIEAIANSTIDALCLGEGEYALVDFLTSGFTFQKNMIRPKNELPEEFYPFADLDKLPLPDRDILYSQDSLLRNMPSKQFLSGRGCPYHCTYCHNHAFNNIFRKCGNIIRKKSVDYLLEEIKDVKRKYLLKRVVFQDDTFIINKKWFFEFCERFPKEVGLPYTCNIRSNLIDEPTVEALKQSNCVAVNWSIESGNAFIRNNILKRNISKENILNTGYLLNKYKIPNRIGNIIGIPGEKFEEMMETLQLNIEVCPSIALANIFIPFKGLELTDYAFDNNYLPKNMAKNLPKSFFIKSILNYTNQEKIIIVKLLYLFPIIVKYPQLLYNSNIFNYLLKVPRQLLKVMYDVVYGYNLMKLYCANTSLITRLRILKRFIIA
jgi:anaerobic magnesium-protoporphyrin IX monomethyl ester cyclase